MRSARWSNIIDTALFPYLTLPIILETLGIREKKFSVTRKDAVTDSRSFTLALPHLFFILLSALAIYQCYTVWMPASFVAALVVMYWLVLNTFILIMAVFFILGRKKQPEKRVPHLCDAGRTAGNAGGMACPREPYRKTLSGSNQL